MLDLTPLTLDLGHIIALCLDGSRNKDATLIAKINSALPLFRQAESDFDGAMLAESVYMLDSSDFEVASIDSHDLSAELYERGMVRRSGRPIYDLLLSAARDRCPLCDLPGAATLDHHLPKKKFPLLCVSILNLIPCCHACNHVKLETVAGSVAEQTLHPYYDSFVNRSQWLYARVVGRTVEFYFDAPMSWTAVQAERVKNHAEKFGLFKRYGAEFSFEIPDKRYRLEGLLAAAGPSAVRDYLTGESESAVKNRLNGFRGIGFLALANDSAFCGGDFTRW